MSGFAEDYVDVAERLRIFREKHPDGALRPLNPHKPFDVLTMPDGSVFVVYVAAAYRTPDDPIPGVGSAWEPFPGPTRFTKDSELQNAETSAWGRAILAALAADSKHVASADEVRNRTALPDYETLSPAILEAFDALPAEAKEQVLEAVGTKAIGAGKRFGRTQLAALHSKWNEWVGSVLDYFGGELEVFAGASTVGDGDVSPHTEPSPTTENTK